MQNNQPKTNVPAQQSCEQQLQVALPLKDSKEAKQKLATRLFREFHAAKTYGKQAESLEAIIPLFTAALSEFPIDKVEWAFDQHAQRSEEFPTRADILSLIRRNGKPPLSEAMYIQLSRKDPETRTRDDWQYIRDFEEEQNQGSEFQDDGPTLRDQNTQLRKQIIELKQENRKLSDLLHETRISKGLEKPKPSLMNKVQQTIAEMRRSGASEDAIEEFSSQHAVSPA
jgi:hypothetical protein